MRKNEHGERLCSDASCDMTATHTSIYTTAVCYCILHVPKLLAIAEAIGHPNPSETVRPMTDDEIKPKE